MNLSILRTISESFEEWYNTTFKKDVSIIIEYKDTQSEVIKSYHTVSINVESMEKDALCCNTLLRLCENYNHGTENEEEIQKRMIKKLLYNLYGFHTN